MIDRNYKGKKLRLDLDSIAEEVYFYTEYDIKGSGHSITIKAEELCNYCKGSAKKVMNKIKSKFPKGTKFLMVSL